MKARASISHGDAGGGLGAGAAITGLPFYGDDAAVGEDGEFLAEVYFGDADGVEVVWAFVAVEGGVEGGEDDLVLLGVVSELGDCLGDEDVEPVEGFGLVALDVVVGFGEDGGGGEGGYGAEGGDGLFGLEAGGGVGGG